MRNSRAIMGSAALISLHCTQFLSYALIFDTIPPYHCIKHSVLEDQHKGQSRPKAGCERKGFIYGQALRDTASVTSFCTESPEVGNLFGISYDHYYRLRRQDFILGWIIREVGISGTLQRNRNQAGPALYVDFAERMPDPRRPFTNCNFLDTNCVISSKHPVEE